MVLGVSVRGSGILYPIETKNFLQLGFETKVNFGWHSKTLLLR